MEHWKFLIQREGDRGWRTIETGNLQLLEGKYRIVANSNLLDTQIQTRVTHQTLGSTVPQRRSQSCTQITNPRGVLAIVPFTHLQSGIWQFVCSGTTSAQTAWHQILKLRVLPRTQLAAPINSTNPLQIELLDLSTATAPLMPQGNSQPQTDTLPITENDDPTPTEPLIPISMLGEQENWADGLDRLLEQLERESLQTHQPQPAVRKTFPGTIQLNAIVDLPSQLICLDRSTFSGIIPGHRLTISGACNLQLLKVNLLKSVKIDKLSICLRHPQTSEIIALIEQSLPPNFDTFTFGGHLELPTEPKVSLLLGEVNLYDKHNIQLASSGFTVALNLNPLHESELSLLQLFDRNTDSLEPNLDFLGETFHQRITQELQLEAVTMGTNKPSIPPRVSQIRPLNLAQDPPVPTTYKREVLFTHPDIEPVNLPETIDAHYLTNDITGDLEIDFAMSTGDHPISTQPNYLQNVHHYENLEIVIDD
jgi:hypothetical protein